MSKAISLRNNRDDDTIEVREDDKSGTFVICDKSDYKDAALNDLNKQTNIYLKSLVR